MGMMRISADISVLALGALLGVAPCSASIFGNKVLPVPQWGLDAAKTPTPDIAKNAEAVILFSEELLTVDDHGRATQRNRKVLRILKPQGRDQGFCQVSYDVDQKVSYLHVWTITPDGKQLQAMEADFHEVGHTDDPILLFTEKMRVAMAPGRDPGSVVVCESEEQASPYMQEQVWDFQHDIPVVTESLEVDLPSGVRHTDSWHNFTPVKAQEVAPNHWRWELNQVPNLDLREVPSAPEWSALVGRMSVLWGDVALEGKENQWRAIGSWIDKLEAHRPDPTPEISAKAHELTDGVTDYYQKLSRVTDYVQKNIRYFIISRGIGGLQAHPAGDIFKYRYGDCKDKATLVISMLQVAGIHAYYVPVDDKRGVVDPDNPSLAGDHMITAIEVPASVHDERLQAVINVGKGANSKQYLIFDPTDERTPVGSLRAVLQGSYGILANGAESQVFQLPVLGPSASGAERKGEFKLTADGTLSGTVDSTKIGSEGGRTRMLLKYRDAKELRDGLEQSVGADIPGVSLQSYKYDEPEALDKPVTLHYEVTARQYAHSAGPLLLVRPRVVGTDTLPNDNKPRTVPINLEATGRWHDSYNITIPDGYVVDDMPDPVNLDMDFATYHSSVSAKDKVLHYEREFTVKKVELPADRQMDFKHMEGTILSDEKATVVLKKQS